MNKETKVKTITKLSIWVREKSIEFTIHFQVLSEVEKKIFFNSVWLSVDKIYRLSLLSFINFWLARYLGPTNWGLLNYVFAFVAIFSPFTSLGIERVVIAKLSTENKNIQSILTASIVLKSVGSLIAITLAIIVSQIIHHDDSLLKLMIIITSFASLFLALDIIDLFFQSISMSKYSVIMRNVTLTFISLAELISIFIKAPVIVFVYTNFFEAMFVGVGFIWLFYCKNNSLEWDFKKIFNLAVDIFKDSKYIFFSLITYFLYMKFDQIFIGKFLGEYQLGIYSSSSKLFELPTSIVHVITVSIFPYMTKLYFSNKEKYYDIYEKISSALSLLSIIIILFVLLWGEYIIKIVYGSAYSSSSSVLKIQIVAILFMFNAALRSGFLTISGNQKILLYSSLMSALLSVLLNIFLITRLGIYGAAITQVVTQFLALYFSNILFKETKIIFSIQSKAFLLFRLFKQNIHN